MEELCPGMSVEITSREPWWQAKVARDTAHAEPEAGRNVPVIARHRLGLHERRLSTPEDENSRIDARRRLEDPPRESARQRDLVERTPDGAADAARPGHGTLERHSPLDHQIGADERR